MNTKLNIFTPTEPWNSFTESYIKLRDKEKRLIGDDLLQKLPGVPSDHPHAKTWQMRAHGLKVLMDHLKRQFKSGDPILDIGCGNGWMSNRLAEAGYEVTAIDVNLPELEQAHRVFAREGLRFAFADLFTWKPDRPFKVAVFGSSFQYFENPNQVLERLFSTNPDLLSVIILDTPFYTTAEKPEAAQRTAAYYSKMGFPQMAAHYHHHSLADFQFPFTTIYQPTRGLLRKLIVRSPFPIIAVSSND